ncbi:hypothetical protein GCM10017714_18840 [Curtobacterium pusillum]|uniref:C-deglycosylation enzyme beta subunit n=1 Tax=Curtobacterium pusillum TaxID=69373 RepID=A0ABX2M7B4_9MICO|nr:DUF6379 domain-containing protein [Curtobacterium pusillum]NUU12668.1 hypothetical protein [Curtobacterium pusillum]GLK33066.1 hypothetical protein GCM10017610_33510 [Curtobacterium pusillum]
MFDTYVFTEGSARNVLTGSGTDAFQVETLITYYRGIPLSMVHAIELVVDGVDVPQGEILISPNNQDWFTLDEATTVTTYRWEYGTPLFIRWLNGGLSGGEHEVTLRLKIRVAYIPIPFGGERTRTVTV